MTERVSKLIKLLLLTTSTSTRYDTSFGHYKIQVLRTIVLANCKPLESSFERTHRAPSRGHRAPSKGHRALSTSRL